MKAIDYKDYAEYLAHQSSKLRINPDRLQPVDLAQETSIFKHYATIRDWRGITILCVGARLGGEVRAFKRMGAVAIGIDVEPGTKNQDVLYGDAHCIAFPNSCFDCVYSNAFDHLFVDRAIAEIARVLKPAGILYLELVQQKKGSWEVMDTSAELLRLPAIVKHFPDMKFNVSQTAVQKTKLLRVVLSKRG